MPFQTLGNDIFAHHGRQLIQNFIQEQVKGPVGVPPPPPPQQFRVDTQSSLPPEPVGILGAGATGLYTALILDDLGIPYKILEARDRVGGRLYTHTFPNQTGAPYNYFDVGAMRFPEIPAMRRVFQLCDYPPLNTGDLALKKKLKPFFFRGAANNDTFLSYNGVTVKQNAVPTTGDPFQGEAVIQDANPQPYLRAGAKAIADDVIAPFATRLLDDLANNTTDGWEYMISFDLYSTRSYMSIQYRPSRELNLPAKPLPTDVVNWVETFDKSTGWYDRALSETVLEAVAFGWSPSTNPLESTPWWCIDGGAFQIADTMAKYIRSRKRDAITLNTRVTAIALTKSSSGSDVMEVTTDGHVTKHTFSHVVTSIPLPVMRTIDLTKAGLTPMQSNALRQLNYGPSIKIGMQFRTAWWTTALDKDGKPLNIIGGQTYTDSPLRTVVYPSFGDVCAGKTTTLIASYCWTEDAERLGSLIGNGDQVLIDLVLRELGTIHNVTVDFLRGQLIDTFAWNWSRDPYTMGAFAFFGPGKFGNVYTALNNPAAAGHLHFAGEAISVRHAWVEGALDSAWRAVFELLLQPGFATYQKKFFENWGVNAEWFQQDAVPADAPPPKMKKPITPGPGGLIHLPIERESPPEPVDLSKLLGGSVLVQHITVTHPEL